MIIAWCNTATESEAKKISRKLVENNLAACVTILTGSISVYKWDGELQVEGEHTLMIKTIPQNKEKLISAIKDTHSYDVPEIIFTDVIDGDDEYLEWVRKECGGK
jgi:uncharacterized protein involved in tolerance to divalent cations